MSLIRSITLFRLAVVVADRARPHQFDDADLRDGKALAAGFDDQRRDDRQGQRDLDGEMVPLPAVLFSSMVPPIFSMLVLTTSMPTPRPDTAVTVCGGGEPGAEDEAPDLAVGHAASSASVARPLR